MKTLKAVYDLKTAPLTFDFLCFLALADCLRQHAECDRISMTILADGFRKAKEREFRTQLDEKMWRIDGILKQCVSICPTVTELSVTDQVTNRKFHYPIGYPDTSTPYTPRHLIGPYQTGSKPNTCLKAPVFARELVPEVDVTLSIRSARHFPERNPDLGDWIAFHKLLRDRGHKVAVIPDQEDPSTYTRDWDGDVYVPAAFDLRLRLAVYESAKMNFGSCHGPFSALFYTDAPFLMFDHLRGGVLTPEVHENLYGFPVGGQHAWSNENQIITWENSTFDNLVRWFEKQEHCLA